MSFSIHETANVSVTDSGFFLQSQDRQVQGLEACGCSPTIGRDGKEMEKTPVSDEILVG